MAPLWRTGLWASLGFGTFYALRLALAPSAPLPWPPLPWPPMADLTPPECLALLGAGLLTYGLYGALGQWRRAWVPAPTTLHLSLLALGGLFAMTPEPLLAQLGESLLWCPPLALFGMMALTLSPAGLPDVLGPLSVLSIITLAVCIGAHRPPRPSQPQPPPLENAPP